MIVQMTQEVRRSDSTRASLGLRGTCLGGSPYPHLQGFSLGYLVPRGLRLALREAALLFAESGIEGVASLVLVGCGLAWWLLTGLSMCMWVCGFGQAPTDNCSIKMEVGIEDCLHIEFEYDKQK